MVEPEDVTRGKQLRAAQILVEELLQRLTEIRYRTETDGDEDLGKPTLGWVGRPRWLRAIGGLFAVTFIVLGSLDLFLISVQSMDVAVIAFGLLIALFTLDDNHVARRSYMNGFIDGKEAHRCDKQT